MKFRLPVIPAVYLALTICGTWAAHAAPPTDPCALLTQDHVSAVLGTAVGAGKQDAPRMCSWSAPNQPNSINAKKIALVTSDARAFGYAKTPVVPGVKTTAVSGVCDDAVYSVTPGVRPGLGIALYVEKGDSHFNVHVYGFPDQAKAWRWGKRSL